MALEIVTVPCLADNYAFLLHESDTGETALIDAPESFPILNELEKRGWQLTEIWITHHHSDHVDGIHEIRDETGAKVVGGAADEERLPPLNAAYRHGERFRFAGHEVHVLDVSGHTVGHIAFHVPDAPAVFCGDSLFALGCGRLFEGTPAQMWTSLSRLADLPGDTLVCCGHEYTLANARFAVTVEPANKDLAARVQKISDMRERGDATVPSLMADERATNPFLRAGLQSVKDAIGLPAANDVESFAEIRRRKDNF